MINTSACETVSVHLIAAFPRPALVIDHLRMRRRESNRPAKTGPAGPLATTMQYSTNIFLKSVNLHSGPRRMPVLPLDAAVSIVASATS